MSNVRSWLGNRSGFTDWLGDHQTNDRKLTNLDYLSSSSGAVATHPGQMQTLRWCVGLFRLGGILYNHRDSQLVSAFVDDTSAVEGQWLEQREDLSGWLGNHESLDRKLVSLQNQNEGLIASPLLFQMLRFCVGFQRLGGILFDQPQSWTGLNFDSGTPVAVGGQWLLQRSLLSDWAENRKSNDGKLVLLETQFEGFCAHPLAIGMLRNTVGLFRPGGIAYPYVSSRTTIATAEDDLLLDAISDEELHQLIDEDTGEPLGLG